MKYELNTPYDFEVRNVSQDNDSLSFEVGFGGNLFPVKAYPEQIGCSKDCVMSNNARQKQERLFNSK